MKFFFIYETRYMKTAIQICLLYISLRSIVADNMAESPETEVIIGALRDDKGNTCNDHEYEDANETLEDPRIRYQARGGGDDYYDRNGDAFGYAHRRDHVINVKPEPYDGKDDWEEYITQFEVCAELGNWRENEMALTLASALRGQARTFYISLPQLERRNYRILKQRLGSRFGSSTQDTRWLSRLETRKRTSGESIAALADDLRQMTQRAYKDFDPRAQEVIALNQLFKSVSPDVKYQCRDCKTLSEAVGIIERYEAIMGDPSDKRRQLRMLNTMDLKEDQDTIQGLSRRMEKLETERKSETSQRGVKPREQRIQTGRSRGRCYICESQNHYFKDCPILIRCKEEMKRQPTNSDSRGNAMRGNYNNKPSQGRNQGNFYSPLTH